MNAMHGLTTTIARRVSPAIRTRARTAAVPPALRRTPRAAEIELVAGGARLPEHLHGAVVALGNFDGVHCGHQAVIGRAVALAREMGRVAIVATFDPHPRRFFRPGQPPFRLTSLDQRRRMLGRLGVDALMVFAFDERLAAITPEEFVARQLQGFGGVVTGADFSFGRNREGDVARLASLCAQRGMICTAIDKVAADERDISSTRIREALSTGDCIEAARLLTRSYAVEGVLRRGRRDDPALPLVDASMHLGDYVRPRRGVYAVRATLEDGRRLGGSAFLAATDDVLELFLVDLTSADLERSATIEFIAHLHDADAAYDPFALRRVIQTDREEAYGVVAKLTA